MVFIKELNLILDSIPKLLQYFIPGYWTIFVFRYFCSKKVSDHMMNIMSCVVSYILISIIAFFRVKCSFMSTIPDIAIINSSIAVILGTVFSILLALIFSSKCFSKITKFLFHKTPNEDIWRDVLDLKNGSNLKVYLKNEDYYIIGHHKNHEEKEGESWLAVSAFGKFDKVTNENYKEEPKYLDDENVIYTIRFSDIEHIEIF